MDDSIVLCQFEAPIMSFGVSQLDKHGHTGLFPCLSTLTGLVGNALGFDRARDTDKLDKLQAGMSYAVRCDRPGFQYRDFQTAFLLSPHMRMSGDVRTSAGWDDYGREAQWTREPEKATFVRYRYYWTDASYLVALTLGDAGVTTDDVGRALRSPARPLFLGRAGCFPSAPIFYKNVRAGALLEALTTEPPLPRATCGTKAKARWPAAETAASSHIVQVWESKNWRNSTHTGMTLMREGVIKTGVPS